jgi:hypothetical protein
MINFERRNEEIIEKECEEPKLKPKMIIHWLKSPGSLW